MNTPPAGIKSLSQLDLLKIYDDVPTVMQTLAKFIYENHDFRLDWTMDTKTVSIKWNKTKPDRDPYLDFHNGKYFCLSGDSELIFDLTEPVNVNKLGNDIEIKNMESLASQIRQHFKTVFGKEV